MSDSKSNKLRSNYIFLSYIYILYLYLYSNCNFPGEKARNIPMRKKHGTVQAKEKDKTIFVD